MTRVAMYSVKRLVSGCEQLKGGPDATGHPSALGGSAFDFRNFGTITFSR